MSILCDLDDDKKKLDHLIYIIRVLTEEYWRIQMIVIRLYGLIENQLCTSLSVPGNLFILD